MVGRYWRAPIILLSRKLDASKLVLRSTSLSVADSPREQSRQQTMDKDEAHEYLSSLLNQNLRVVTTDGRLFWGSFKCTDAEKNIVLAHTYEYRPPTDEQRQAALASSSEATVKVDMSSRYLGLVVVPGHRIVKMEVERFASQMGPRAGSSLVA